MALTDSLEPLGIWVLFAALIVLARRERRSFYQLPVIGISVVAASSIAWLILMVVAGPSWRGIDGTFLRLMLGLAGAAALPTVYCWVKTGLACDLPRLAQRTCARRRWVGACLLLALVAAVAYYVYGLALARHGAFAQYDLLFDADPVRYIRLLEGTATRYEQVMLKHPLFVLFGRGLFLAIAAGSGPQNAAVGVSAVVGGLCLAAAAEYFRLVTASRTLALALAALLGATSGHIVFAATPETHIFSAGAIVLLHLLVARGLHGGVHFRHEVLAGVCATGVTITHVITAAVCFVARSAWARKRRRLLRWAACLLTILAAAMVLQGLLVPAAVISKIHFHLARAEAEYFTPHALGTPGHAVANVARGVLAESVVGFTPVVRMNDSRRPVLGAGPYTGVLARLCVFIWAAGLLGAAAVVFTRRGLRRPTLWAALACLCGTGVLHLFYGNDCVFLYSCTFTFYLFAIVAHAAAGVPRRWLTPAVIAFGLLLLVNNAAFFGRVLQALDSLPNL